MALMSTLVLAVPAKRGLTKTVKLADGTEVKVELRGDEFCHYWQAEDGRAFAVNTETGIYEKIDVEQKIAKAAQRRNTVNEMRVKRSPAMRVGEKGGAYTGEKKGLIVLVNFTDVKFKPEHTLEFYKRVANEEGFSEFGYRGSVKDYFKDQSYGKFTLDFDVVGPVELNHPVAYYGRIPGAGPNDDNDNIRNIGQMVVDACTEAERQGYDFRQYDWDGDGEVEQVFVLYAGEGEASGGDYTTIWPHEFNLQYAIGKKAVIGGVYVDTYACGNEIVASRDGKYKTSGLGTICHEFSHCLGLPDMYDTSYSGNYGMNCWSLMDQGSYNGEQFCPAGYTSYERMFSGWLQPTELKSECEISNMQALVNKDEAYIIYNDAHKDEYFLLENRVKEKWDSEVPGQGLLILHVDYNKTLWLQNAVNSTKTQHCTIIPADNKADVYSARTDPYPYSTNNSLTDDSRPYAKLNNKNTDGSVLMHKPIENIKKSGDGSISFSFRNDNPTGIAEVATDEGHTGDNRIYSIDGRYMGKDMNALKKGIYVINGKKIVK